MDPGAVIGGAYLIEEKAASGGMGTVFRARDQRDGRLVAIKVLTSDDPVEVERFQREAVVLAELTHPSIVRYLAHGRYGDDEHYIVEEWVEGNSLAEVLAETGLTVGESVDLVRRVAEALSMAHRRGIIHRDVKPGNLLLPAADLRRVKVADFGIAKRQGDAIRLTSTGAMVGTPGYMAPEQARASRDIQPSADVFALGCVLYECVTGEPAFEGQSIMALRTKILFTEPPDVRELAPEAPAELAALVRSMLAKEPASRPTQAGEVATELAALGDLGGSVRRPGRRHESATVGARGPGRTAAGSRPDETTSPRPAAGRLVCMLFARLDQAAASPTQPTLSPERVARVEGLLGAELISAGVRLEILRDGSMALMMPSGGDLSLQARQAARCALALRRAMPEASICLAAGEQASDREITEEVIDRGVQALEVAAARAVARGVQGSIDLDAISANLLEGEFEIERGPRGRARLVGER